MRSFLALVVLLAASPAWARDPYVFERIEFPGASRTQARGISDDGVVTGWYEDAAGVLRGYRARDGIFVSLDYPGETTTLALGSTPEGDAVVTWDDASFVSRGFRCDSRGACQSHEGPGADATIAVGGNDRGEIVGVAFFDGFATQVGYHYANGSFVRIEFPDESGAEVLTTAHDVNERGEIVGVAEIESDPERIVGWKLANGRFIEIAYPGAEETIPFASDERGTVVGDFVREHGERSQGFIAERGEFAPLVFDPALNNIASGINRWRQVAGLAFDDSRQLQIGWVASPIPISTARELSAALRHAKQAEASNLARRIERRVRSGAELAASENPADAVAELDRAAKIVARLDGLRVAPRTAKIVARLSRELENALSALD